MGMLHVGYKRISNDTGICRTYLTILSGTAGEGWRKPKGDLLRERITVSRWFREQGISFVEDGVLLKRATL